MNKRRNLISLLAAVLVGLMLTGGCGQNAYVKLPGQSASVREAVSLAALYGLLDVPAAATAQPSISSENAELIAQLRNLIYTGNTQAALNRVLSAGDAGSQLDIWRGICYGLNGSDDRSRRYLTDYNGSEVLAYYTYGLLSHRAGKLSQASQAFYMGSKCPVNDYIDARYHQLSLMSLATVLGSESRLRAAADAWELFDTAIHSRPFSEPVAGEDGEYYRDWGLVLYDLGDFAEAAEILDVAFSYNKSDPQVPPMLAEAFLREGRLAEAEDVAAEMLTGPTDKSVCVELMVRLLERCESDACRRQSLLRLTAGTGNDVPVVLALARTAWLAGMEDYAIELLGDRIAEVELPYILAQTQFRWLLYKNRPADVLDLAEQLLILAPDQYDQLSELFDLSRKNDSFSNELIAGRAESAASIAAVQPQLAAARYTAAALAASRNDDRPQAVEYLQMAQNARAEFFPAVSELLRIWPEIPDANVQGYIRTFEGADMQWFSLYLRAFLLARSNDQRQGQAMLRMSLEQNDLHGRARRMLALDLFHGRQFGEAFTLLANCVEEYGELSYGVLQSHMYTSAAQLIERSNPKQAEEARRRADISLANVLAFDAAYPPALSMVILDDYNNGLYIAANDTAEKLYALGCRDDNFLLAKVTVQCRDNSDYPLISQGRYERAMSDIRDAIAVSGESGRLMRIKASLESRSGHHLQAAETALGLYRQNANEPLVLAGEAAAYYVIAGEMEKARELIGEIYQQGDSRIYDYMYYKLSATQDPQSSAELLEELFPAASEDMQLWRALSLAVTGVSSADAPDQLITTAAELKNYAANVSSDEQREAASLTLIDLLPESEAIDFARDWFAREPASYWLKRNRQFQALSDVLWYMDSRFMAKADVQARFRSNYTPIDAIVWRLVRDSCPTRATEIAMAAITKLRSGDRDSRELAEYTTASLAGLLYFNGYHERAYDILRAALGVNPDSYVLLTMAVGIMTDQPDNNKYRRRAMKLSPLDPQINNNLAYAWADAGVKLDRAAEMLARATEYGGGGAHIKDSLGWLMYKRGWLPRARLQLEQAINDPAGDSAVVYDHLGDVYWRLGLEDQAAFMWAEAADLGRTDLKLRPQVLDADSRSVVARAEAKLRAVQQGDEPKIAPTAAETGFGW